ncbi:MAG TPA: TetR/AcrR family transcriptional regulator [Fontimonas sp.]
MAATQPTKARLSRVEQSAQRAQELLDAAWLLFCEKGYEAVTIDEVAARAGYSRMPVYSLFGDKQNLYFELWQRAVGGMLTQIRASQKAGASLRSNLQRLAELMASPPDGDTQSAPGSNSGEHLFFAVQTIALSRADIADKLELLSRQVISEFAEVLALSRLEPRDVLRSDLNTVAAHLVAQINGMATVKFQTRRSYFNTRELTELFVAIALKAVHA